jgi:hypothetical protein
MGVERVQWRQTWAEVSSGKVVRRPLSMASQRVEMDGEKREAWRKVMRSRTVEVALTAWADGEGWALVKGRSRCQRRETGERCPERMVMPSLEIVTEEVLKVAVQPWSHRRPMEMSAPEESVGKM